MKDAKENRKQAAGLKVLTDETTARDGAVTVPNTDPLSERVFHR